MKYNDHLYNRNYYVPCMNPKPLELDCKGYYPEFSTEEEARQWVIKNYPEYSEINSDDFIKRKIDAWNRGSNYELPWMHFIIERYTTSGAYTVPHS